MSNLISLPQCYKYKALGLLSVSSQLTFVQKSTRKGFYQGINEMRRMEVHLSWPAHWAPSFMNDEVIFQNTKKKKRQDCWVGSKIRMCYLEQRKHWSRLAAQATTVIKKKWGIFDTLKNPQLTLKLPHHTLTLHPGADLNPRITWLKPSTGKWVGKGELNNVICTCYLNWDDVDCGKSAKFPFKWAKWHAKWFQCHPWTTQGWRIALKYWNDLRHPYLSSQRWVWFLFPIGVASALSGRPRWKLPQLKNRVPVGRLESVLQEMLTWWVSCKHVGLFHTAGVSAEGLVELNGCL